ncbi:MAG: MBL fold metallo-hydrolase [Bacteroidota bacterium]|nr:MBL fold metallo-hydrolase [Bacteroidota bacterium]
MKRNILLIACLVFLTVNFVNCQTGSPWFSVKEVSPRIWIIGDHGADNMYLVEGTDSALLIDAGLGVADLASQVKKLTSKPLIVVNTHGHSDHAGSNYQFAKVYVHPADSAAARACNSPEARANSSKNMQGGNAPAEAELFKGKPFNTKLVPVREGHLFRLGGRTLKVIETPGHTPGEIILLDIENKLLFTGDNNNVLVWLFLQNCKPLHEYLATLQKEAAMILQFTTIYPGHGTPLPADFVNDQIACVKGILNNTLERKPYKSFAGNSLVSVSGRASVAFNPDNL